MRRLLHLVLALCVADLAVAVLWSSTTPVPAPVDPTADIDSIAFDGITLVSGCETCGGMLDPSNSNSDQQSHQQQQRRNRQQNQPERWHGSLAVYAFNSTTYEWPVLMTWMAAEGKSCGTSVDVDSTAAVSRQTQQTTRTTETKLTVLFLSLRFLMLLLLL